MKPSILFNALVSLVGAGEPVLIKGAPGIGKSDIVAQACAKLGYDLVITHPVIGDPTDYKGLPAVTASGADFLPFGELKRLISATSPLVYFLDDLGQAPPLVQAACMQLILARRINGFMVSPQVRFIAATNRRQDRAAVTGILEPVKSRFATILELEIDGDDWERWALTHDMPVELVAFRRFRPDFLSEFKATGDITNSPSPRTLAAAGRLIKLGLNAESEFEILAGAVGEAMAGELVAFLKTWRKLPSVDSVILAPDAAPVPDDPATLYAICGALAGKATDSNFAAISRYVARLPKEFGVFLVSSAVRRNQAIASTAAFIKWSADNAGVLI